jgi:hypothetical protein
MEREVKKILTFFCIGLICIIILGFTCSSSSDKTEAGNEISEKIEKTDARYFLAYTIPGSVMNIGWGAFTDNPLVSITIGANVPISLQNRGDRGLSFYPSFDEDFDKLYTGSGMRAGTYVNRDGEWRRR